VIHAPIDGRPSRLAPVFIMRDRRLVIRDFRHIERITQMSSATLAEMRPELAHLDAALAVLLNLNGDFIRLPVLRCVRSCRLERLAVVLSPASASGRTCRRARRRRS
jgi:hypothetical protein